jgi:hypothetical protein
MSVCGCRTSFVVEVKINIGISLLTVLFDVPKLATGNVIVQVSRASRLMLRKRQ